MKDNSGRLGTEKIWKLVLQLAIPAMLAQFVNVAYSIVDRIYIGNIPEIGGNALAGVGVCGPIVTLISSFAYLVGLGGAPLMAIRLGEGEEKRARDILSTGFLLLVILSVILTAAVFFSKELLLGWFGASTPELFSYAEEYLTWYVFGTLFAILAAGLNSYIVAQGCAKLGMTASLIGAAANIALDPVFIFTLDMGVAGAAIATVLSQVLSAAFSVLVLMSKNRAVRLRINGFSGKIARKILTLGISPFLIIATDSVMLLALNGVLQRYGGENGDLYITAATIMLSFMQVITMPLGGISSGTQPILSYNYGACRMKRIKEGEKWILFLAILFTFVMFLAAQFFSEPFVSVFTRDEALQALSVRFIRVYTLAIIPLSFQYVFVDGLTALGIAPIAITLSLFRKLVVMLSLTFLLPMYFGAEAALYAEPDRGYGERAGDERRVPEHDQSDPAAAAGAPGACARLNRQKRRFLRLFFVAKKPRRTR